MSALTIDTLAASQTLRKRGFTEDQATGVVEVLHEIDASALATKADIRDVRAEIRELRSEIESTAANLKVDILRWLIVTQIALAGVLLTAIRYLAIGHP